MTAGSVSRWAVVTVLLVLIDRARDEGPTVLVPYGWLGVLGMPRRVVTRAVKVLGDAGAVERIDRERVRLIGWPT